MSDAAWAAFGFIMASMIWFGFFSVSFRNWHQRHQTQIQLNRKLAEQIVDLVAQKSPVYQIGVGVDPVARRNPSATVDPFLEAAEWGEGGGMIHIITGEDNDV